MSLINKILFKFSYQIDYNRSYQSSHERALRREIFLWNLQTIGRHNRDKNITFNLTINQFADMTFKELHGLNYINNDEFFEKVLMTKYVLPDEEDFFDEDFSKEAPMSFDWREHGADSRVKNQEMCGGCYIFASLDAIENKIFMESGRHFEFSRQEILDCANEHGSLGCSGGILSSVISYINEMRELSLEKNYPYEGVESVCRNDNNVSKVNISKLSMGNFDVENEMLLKTALFNEGPIIVVVNHLHESFFRYSNGIYYEPKCNDIDNSEILSHAMLIVGYGSDDQGDYWIVKNSYGPAWGENGFIRMARNRNNHCNIASFNMFPLFN